MSHGIKGIMFLFKVARPISRHFVHVPHDVLYNRLHFVYSRNSFSTPKNRKSFLDEELLAKVSKC